MCACPWLLAAAEFQAGTARLDITPQNPIWLAGYGSRTHPSEGIVHPLWAKALAIEDSRRSRIVIVTTDLIGLPHAVTDFVAARAEKDYGLERSRILFNSSHTHTGPVVRLSFTTFQWTTRDRTALENYHRELAENLFTVIGAALGDLAPAQVSYASGQAHFAVNRREPSPEGIRIGVNPDGPVDPAVPVLRVRTSDGKLKAVLFGYACHNTTLTGEFYGISGDYAGFAQIELEKANPGSTAMFLMLCGGDQNPNPRGSVELAERHGKSLAAEVQRVLASNTKELRGPLSAAFQNVDLNFALTSRATFEEELNSPSRARALRAKAMLDAYDARQPPRQIQYPIQAIRFGKVLAILALGGEAVVDYALRAKHDYGGDLIVAGYSNDVMSYIPSRRVLREGGYEPVDSMVAYGLPGPYADDVEDRIFAGIRQVMRRVGLGQK